MVLKPEDAVPKIAKKDIICYKLCRRHRSKLILTFFQGAIIRIGQTYISGIRLLSAVRVYESQLYKFFSIDFGLHSFKTQSSCDKFCKLDDVIIVKCIIPKGSTYYNGSYDPIYRYKKDSYVSDTLKYVEIVQDNNTRGYGT